jgi:hypothetical protein
MGSSFFPLSRVSGERGGGVLIGKALIYFNPEPSADSVISVAKFFKIFEFC